MPTVQRRRFIVQVLTKYKSKLFFISVVDFSEKKVVFELFSIEKGGFRSLSMHFLNLSHICAIMAIKSQDRLIQS